MTLYISSISFEDRCRALPQGLQMPETDDHVLLLDFLGYENVAPYLFNRSEIINNLQGKGYPTQRLMADLSTPIGSLRRIETAISNTNPSDVILDISTLPRNYLFGLCRLLVMTGTPTKIRYYRPNKYGNELSRGIGSVRTMAGFEGDVGPRGETILVVILGFEGYKALHAWERIGPSKVIALFGDPPYKPEFLELSKKYNAEFLEQAGNVKTLSLHTHDVIVAKSQLQAIYEEVTSERPENSFILCPLGTKLQSLAAFSIAYKNQDVAVSYVSSLSYFTDDYSRGHEPDFIEVSLSGLIANG